MSIGKVSIIDNYITPLFDNIECGEFFMYKEHLCVRIDKNANQWVALDLVAKEHIHIPHSCRVQLVDCQLEYEYCVSED